MKLAPFPWLALLAWIAFCSAAPALGARVDGAIVIGESRQVWSQTLGEQRRVLIYLPPHYERSGLKYPVLYLLDAEAQFHSVTGVLHALASLNGRVPEMIVVGVTNTNRTRDLTPPAQHPEKLSTMQRAGGGADDFLTFLADELAPWVDARYRTEPYRVLVGHSFGGLFAIHALLQRPASFQAYVAISPSLWWDERTPLARARAGLGSLPPGRRFLYLTWGDHEPTISETTGQLVDWLQAHPPAGLPWAHRYYRGEDHGTTPLRSLPDGLQAVFAGWQPSFHTPEGGERPLDMKQIEAHYSGLSARFGYPVAPSPEAIGWVARQAMERKDAETALAQLRRNVREFPWLADVHRELGKALEELGYRDEALSAYREALRRAIEDENPYRDPVEDYREQARRLSEPAPTANR